jgi:hypothetical protein
MTRSPEQIIEDYLEIVRTHLPESIADDVVTELRIYIFDAAREKGDGEVTERSAKKAVSRFGAPSEVAEEYTASMFLEDEEIPLEQIVDAEIADLPNEIHKPVSPIAPVETSTTRATHEAVIEEGPGEELTEMNQFEALLKVLVVTLFWTVIVSLPGFPLLAVQIPLVILIVVVNFLYLISNGVVFRERYHPEWSEFQTFLTLPQNSYSEPIPLYRYFDFFITILGISITIASAITAPYFVFAAIGVILFLVWRFKYMVRRDTDEDPMGYVRSEFFINLGTALSLSISVTFLTATLWIGSWFALIAMGIFTVFYNTHLVIHLTLRGQDIWWEAEDIGDGTETSLVAPPDPVYVEAAEPEQDWTSIHAAQQRASTEGVVEEWDSEEDEIYEDFTYPPEDEKEDDPRRGMPRRHRRVAAKTFLFTILWSIATIVMSFFIGSFIGVDASGPFRPYWFGSIIVFVAGVQLPIAVLAHWINILLARRRRQLYWDRTEKHWSILRRIVSFPEFVFSVPRSVTLRIDMFMTVFVITILGLLPILNPFPPQFVIVSWSLVALLLARLYYLDKRWNMPESNESKVGEFVMNLLTLSVLNLLIAMTYSMYYIWFGFEVARGMMASWIMFYWFVTTPYLLFLLVSRGQELWSDKEPIKKRLDPLVAPTRDQLVNRVIVRGKQAGRRFYLWVLIGGFLASLLSFIFQTPPNNAYNIMGLTAAFGIFGVGFVFIYFGFRNYRVRNAGANSVFGERHKLEVLADTIISLVYLPFIAWTLFYLLNEYPIWTWITTPIEIYVSLTSLILIVFEILIYAFASLALVIRVVGNTIGFADGRSRSALKLTVASSILLLIAVAMHGGLIMHELTGVSVSPLMFLPWFALGLLLAFQITTCLQQIGELDWLESLSKKRFPRKRKPMKDEPPASHVSKKRSEKESESPFDSGSVRIA